MKLILNYILLILFIGCVNIGVDGGKNAQADGLANAKKVKNATYIDCHKDTIAEFSAYKRVSFRCPNIKDALNISSSISLTDDFKVSPKIYPKVWFWHNVFTHFSKDHYVIHSRLYPNLIFEVVEIKDQKLSRRKVRSIVRKRAKVIAADIRKLAKGRNLSVSQLALKETIDHFVDFKHVNLRLLSDSIRTQRGQRDYIEKGLKVSSQYLPHIQEHFAKKNIPEELAYLAFIESSFNTKAISKVGASGVYQLMKFVTKKDMVITKHIDERSNPIKSGMMAAKILKTNHRMLNDWPLAVTGYNHGPYGLSRALKKTSSKSLDDLIEKYDSKSFGFASKNFYAEFLAIVGMMQNHERWFPGIKRMPSLEYESLTLKKSMRVKRFLSYYRISKAQFIEYNPDFSRKFIRWNSRIPKGFQVFIPTNSKSSKCARSDCLAGMNS